MKNHGTPKVFELEVVKEGVPSTHEARRRAVENLDIGEIGRRLLARLDELPRRPMALDCAPLGAIFLVPLAS